MLQQLATRRHLPPPVPTTLPPLPPLCPLQCYALSTPVWRAGPFGE